MANNFALEILKTQMTAAAQELRGCNALTEQYGLSLSETEIRNLVERRFGALRDTGRVEFGEGILKKLVLAFCDSPYILQENYEETLSELQDVFYSYKNESGDRISDDELIEYMERVFNGRAGGSTDYLSLLSLDELCRRGEDDFDPDDPDEPDDLF